jgi:hypothetical protein
MSRIYDEEAMAHYAMLLSAYMWIAKAMDQDPDPLRSLVQAG